VNSNLQGESKKLKRRIAHRLRPINWEDQPSPMMSGTGIHYEVATRARAIEVGGIGAIHLLAKRIGLPAAIDARLRLLKKHLPYWESDHVMNIAYNTTEDTVPGSFSCTSQGPASA